MALQFKRPPLKAFIYWATVLGVWAIIFVTAFIAVFSFGLPSIDDIDKVEKQPAITYLDRSGALIAVQGSQSAPPVNLDELPPYVPAAFLAVEDRRFYHHPGFDPVGILRAAMRNATKKGGNLAGGSTITQQLARNLFLSSDQNMKRKIQELIMAVKLELKFTKKEILALYLNRVYFGAGAYGIEAASQRYFNKPAKELTIAESALLAGMMKGPSRYSPLSDSERAQNRANIVLNEMVEARVITPEQRAEAVSKPLKVTKTLATAHALYFIDWLSNEVQPIAASAKEDLIVETTLDLAIQTDAERAVQRIMERDAKKKVEQTALVAIDGEGRVRALIGGVSYADSQFNRAIEAHRQAGSSFKPFVYLTAMEAGYNPLTPVVDEPFEIGGWSPENYTKKFLGPMDLQTALAQSINTVAARVANDVGRENVARTARRLGIDSKINTDPAMALGTASLTPLEMARAYVPFSNGGYKVAPHGIIRIRTTSGKILYQYREDVRTQVIANPPLAYMNQMMRQVVISGTGNGIKIPGNYDLAGKTGTTSDYRDAWFVGYTGGFTTAVWVGRDNNTPMARVTGGGTPAAIWRDFMASALTRIKTSAIPTGPVSEMDEAASAAVDELLNSSPAANDNVVPPVVTMEPIPNPEDQQPAPTDADDIFSEAQRRNQ
ncbi:PBP1A family penicillin-binding protein [Asticcacaulis sp. ZE23SCel15]|uniref:transglycosylase domain-containing protein n=1 Tax=Asticcacaulis sp. ZE23SCel15 TaxID=3059027 RepID=UPI00265F764D|nr:PBP1A family penicillin-binding protein [Asticcacaulis sp. ZE23SCel15]WKL58168.1 PBP1A family penicillin-binding protein [Asticcacaulis sp. ZE23SCel15]